MAKLTFIFLLLAVILISGCASQPNQPNATAQQEVHEGPIELSGDQVMTIEDKPNYLHIGNIKLKDNAKLIIKNSNVIVKKQGTRADIELFGNSRLEVTNSRLTPPIEDPANLYLTADDSAFVLLDNSVFYNVLNFVNNAGLEIKNGAKIHSGMDIPEQDGAFGIVQVCCQVKGKIENSEVGSIGLFYGPGESATLDGLKPGQVDHASFFGVNVDNSKILTPITKGPYERGWAIFADENSKVTVKNSELNKFVFQEIRSPKVDFADLKTEQPKTLHFGSVSLENVNVYNEWGFFLRNTDATITDSDGIWLFLFENGKTNLVRSTMVEFDPRGFMGELHFEKGKWLYAGEILSNSHFTISGNYETDQGVFDTLVWDDASTIKRDFCGKTLEFNKQNYKTKQQVVCNGKSYDVDFFTKGLA